MTDKDNKTGRQRMQEAKLARMQAALRENLKRRKEQARGRTVVVKSNDKEAKDE